MNPGTVNWAWKIENRKRERQVEREAREITQIRLEAEVKEIEYNQQKELKSLDLERVRLEDHGRRERWTTIKVTKFISRFLEHRVDKYFSQFEAVARNL